MNTYLKTQQIFIRYKHMFCFKNGDYFVQVIIILLHIISCLPLITLCNMCSLFSRFRDDEVIKSSAHMYSCFCVQT